MTYISRKRIIYYETFKTKIERILDDDIARQGARVRVNLKPVKYYRIGVVIAKCFKVINRINQTICMVMQPIQNYQE